MSNWHLERAQIRMKEVYPDKSMVVNFPPLWKRLFKRFDFDCTEMYRAGFMNGYISAEEDMQNQF